VGEVMLAVSYNTRGKTYITNNFNPETKKGKKKNFSIDAMPTGPWRIHLQFNFLTTTVGSAV
jgi:hypothetical protein